MKSEEEKIREMLIGSARAQRKTAAGAHLRDGDFIRLIESEPAAETAFSAEENGHLSARRDELAPLRRHLADCEACLARFKDFHAFFAPAAEGEAVAAKNEIDAAWRDFSPRMSGKNVAEKENRGFWQKFFPAERKTNYFAALGWGFAALLLLSSIIGVFIARQTSSEKAQLSGEIENRRRTYEELSKTLEQTAQNRDLIEREKNRLAEEKAELQKRIAELQTEVERAGQEKNVRRQSASPANQPPAADNSLVAVNTPIYDVFPADAAVRGNNQSKNELTVPNSAKSIVLILNAAGRADYPSYRAELLDSAGAIIWRGAGLKKDALGNFTLTLARRGLKSGNYRLRLFGRNEPGAAAQIVAEYRLTIEIK